MRLRKKEEDRRDREGGGGGGSRENLEGRKYLISSINCNYYNA